MAVGYRDINNVDFDDLFDPYVQGLVPANTGYRDINNVDLAGRYAPLSYGAKRADVGYRLSNGVDVSNLWAAKGTAVYFPKFIEAQTASYTGGAMGASAAIFVLPDGRVRVDVDGDNSAVGGGHYRYGDSSAGYDFRIYGSIQGVRNATGTSGTMTGKGGISFSAVPPPGNSASFDTGWQAAADNASAFVTWSCGSQSGQGAAILDGTVNVQVRRKSDQVVISTWTAQFSVLSDSQQ